MFFAALTSRECETPHEPHTQSLTANRLRPRGPEREPQDEHVTVDQLSLTSFISTPSLTALYASIFLKSDQPASETLLAIRVFISFEELTLPTAILSYSLTIAVLILWFQSFLLFLNCLQGHVEMCLPIREGGKVLSILKRG